MPSRSAPSALNEFSLDISPGALPQALALRACGASVDIANKLSSEGAKIKITDLELVPHVTLVKINSIALKKFPILVLKRHALVVRLLIANVTLQSLNV